MGLGIAELLTLLLGWAIIAAIVIALLVALYWVIRKAVSGGIRDAQADEARRQTARLE